MLDISVIQTAADQYTVQVCDEKSSTVHKVRVAKADVQRLAPDAGAARLIEESFRFLLERESKESILRTFDLPVISRYFPEYEAEILSRFS
ncbi:hypothetical protein BMS3Abin02_02454 [bacterium BMS3Abin02]|nr:hypothetical protein BMS3Abin02_02454 [bacterium BMS3Abin02]GBE20892.1 hypothetical protein BMS3Bbin01_00233 [bacterium BMS3Bbin01]HDH25129.1 hypothetical protein [Actinomycetota bacterium]HDK45359.1 hypothetical protein [Actinomycetota bacterium]HDL49200.1 hypothetical protein [Actinomycetota bacterium]